MQYTRDPTCFTLRPAFSQPAKKSVSSSFPILRLQLIRNAGASNPMHIPILWSFQKGIACYNQVPVRSAVGRVSPHECFMWGMTSVIPFVLQLWAMFPSISCLVQVNVDLLSMIDVEPAILQMQMYHARKLVPPLHIALMALCFSTHRDFFIVDEKWRWREESYVHSFCFLRRGLRDCCEAFFEVPFSVPIPCLQREGKEPLQASKSKARSRLTSVWRWWHW